MAKKYFLMASILTAFAIHGLAAATVDFSKDIEPIFRDACLKCHGAEKQKGGLRLDSKEAAFKGGKNGGDILPGHADKSDLYRRVLLPDSDDDFMPSKGDPLTKAQTDLIKDWINQGAIWPDDALAKAAEPVLVVPYSDLTPFKPSAAELAAVAKLEAAGIEVRPVAANIPWREASLRGLGSNATDAVIAPFKDVLSLVNLNLAGTKVTDAGLKTLAGLTNLTSLHLEHTPITDAGLPYLAKLPHLAYLNLYATAVTDQGLEELKGMASLRRLFVWQTKVTTNGVADLQKALPAVQILRGWEKEPVALEAKSKVEMKEMKK